MIKVGDKVTRLLGGSVEMELIVTEIDEQFIYCGPPGVGWKFDKESGYEVDDDLLWGVERSDGSFVTGSYIQLS